MKKINRHSIISSLVKLTIIILFISSFTAVFGSQEALTSVSAITGILIFFYVPLNLSVKTGALVTGGSFFILGLLASLNLFLPIGLSLIINLLSIFLMICLFGRPFAYKLYVPYILLYIFASTTSPLEFKLSIRIAALAFSALIITGIYYFRHQKSSGTETLKSMLTIKSIPHEILHVAFTMAVGISLTLLVSQILHFEKAMWICMTIMSLSQIETQIFKDRFKQRMFGSLVGIVVYGILFSLLVPSHLHLPLTLFLAFVYNFLDDYFLQVILITVNALYAANVIWQFNVASINRLLFILIGSLIVYALTRFVKSSYPQRLLNLIPNKSN